MKYVSLILVMILSLFVSCKEGEEIPEASLFIEINSKTIQFTRLAASQIFKVNTNIDDIKCEPIITVVNNNAYKSREGGIILSGKDIRQTISITQNLPVFKNF